MRRPVYVCHRREHNPAASRFGTRDGAVFVSAAKKQRRAWLANEKAERQDWEKIKLR